MVQCWKADALPIMTIVGTTQVYDKIKEKSKILLFFSLLLLIQLSLVFFCTFMFFVFLRSSEMHLLRS